MKEEDIKWLSKQINSIIEAAKNIFGDSYDYSKVVYQDMKTPITLLCIKHNFTFEQKPVYLLRGNRGCKYCSGRGLNTEDFINKSKKVFMNNEFDYSKTVYKNNQTKVVFICNVHRIEWEQLPQSHLKGNNPCQNCNGQKRTTLESFLSMVEKESYYNQFDYSLVESNSITNKHSKIAIRCIKHDEVFVQEINTHLRPSNACSGCNKFSRREGLKLENMLNKVNQDKRFDYSITDFKVSNLGKVKIICTIHKLTFEQTLNGHLSGRIGCPICDKENRLTTFDEFVERVKNIHGENRYSFDRTVLIKGVQGKTILKCNKHDEYFSYEIFRILQGLEGCLKCRTQNISRKEKDLADFVENELGFFIERGYRKVKGLSPKEVDIFIPKKNLAIEFNGLYWHSEAAGKDKNYHYNKYLKCQQAGVRLLTIWEDEWEYKKEIVKSHIKHVLGLNNDERIYARKTIIRLIDKGDAQLFLNDNHIQGFVGASVHIGLFDKKNNNLVAVGSFLKTGGNYHLVRFATSCSVVGGFSKLINYFEKSYNYEKLITFADLSFSDGGLYENNGFIFCKLIKPDYSYIMSNKITRFHKFGFRKEKFKNNSSFIFEEGLTEKELANLNGLERIWDLGKLRFVKEHS